jgi:hypothetical protein
MPHDRVLRHQESPPVVVAVRDVVPLEVVVPGLATLVTTEALVVTTGVLTVGVDVAVVAVAEVELEAVDADEGPAVVVAGAEGLSSWARATVVAPTPATIATADHREVRRT